MTAAEAAATTEPAPADPPWHRLDPRITLVAFLRMLVRLIPAFVAWWFFDTDDDGARWTVIVLAALAVLSPARQALKYLTVRYRVTGDDLEHRTGVLVRTNHRVPLERIRTVDITAPLANRLLGLTVLRVGTGGNALVGDGTAVLDGLPRARALRLRTTLLRAADADATSAVDPRIAEVEGETIQTVRAGWVVYYLFGIWLFSGPLAVIGTVYGFVTMFGQDDWVGERVGAFVDSVPWTAWALTSLALVVVLGVAAGAVFFTEAWWGYRLVREPGGRFRATRGLLTTRNFTADHERMRGATFTEGMVMRLFGGARLSPIMTGVSLQQQMSESATMLPITTRDVAVRVSAQLLGRPVVDDALRPTSGPLQPHPPAARRRAVVRYLLRTAGLAAALAAGIALWDWPPALLLAPAALAPLMVLAADRYYRALGHRLEGTDLYLRRGFFSRRTDVVQVRGINGAHVSQNLFQRLLGLATLTVTTAAGEQAYVGVDLALGDATAIAAAVTEEPILSPAGR